MSRLNKPALTPSVICQAHFFIHEVMTTITIFKALKTINTFFQQWREYLNFWQRKTFVNFSMETLVSITLVNSCLFAVLYIMSQEIVKIWLVEFAWLATSDSLNSPMFSSAKKLVISSEIMSLPYNLAIYNSVLNTFIDTYQQCHFYLFCYWLLYRISGSYVIWFHGTYMQSVLA